MYFKALRHVAPFEILMHRMVWSLVLLFPLMVLAGRSRRSWRPSRIAAPWPFSWPRRSLWAATGFCSSGPSTRTASCRPAWAITSTRSSMSCWEGSFSGNASGPCRKRRSSRPWGSSTSRCASAGSRGWRWRWRSASAPTVSSARWRRWAPLSGCHGTAHSVRAGLSVLPPCRRLGRISPLGPAPTCCWRLRLVTGLPLLMFISGARRLNLSTMGFLQYIAPSCTFLLAVLVYGEPFAAAQLVAFVLIWSALVLYSTDSILYFRKNGYAKRAAPSGKRSGSHQGRR